MESFRNDEVGGGYPTAVVAITDLNRTVFKEVGLCSRGFFGHCVLDAAMPLITTLTT